jgi:transcriptional regulator with XRE-family HTH domain
MADVANELQKHFAKMAEDEGMTQQDLADRLEIDKSRISKMMSGFNNLTMKSFAELCWAMKAEPYLKIHPIQEGVQAPASRSDDLHFRAATQWDLADNAELLETINSITKDLIKRLDAIEAATSAPPETGNEIQFYATSSGEPSVDSMRHATMILEGA